MGKRERQPDQPDPTTPDLRSMPGFDAPPAPDDNHQSGAVIKAPDHESNPLVPAWGTPLLKCPTSFDLTTTVGIVAVYNAQGEGDLTIGRDGAVDMNVSGYLLYPAEITNEETGEVDRVVWTVLFAPDGRTWKTTSEVIPHRLAALLDLCGGKLPVLGVPCTIVERKSRKLGRVYHDIRMRPQPEGGAS